MLAWLNQGAYGTMTQIAKASRISRTFLSQLLMAATIHLDVLLSDAQPQGQHLSSPLDHLAWF